MSKSKQREVGISPHLGRPMLGRAKPKPKPRVVTEPLKAPIGTIDSVKSPSPVTDAPLETKDNLPGNRPVKPKRGWFAWLRSMTNYCYAHEAMRHVLAGRWSPQLMLSLLVNKQKDGGTDPSFKTRPRMTAAALIRRFLRCFVYHKKSVCIFS